MQGRKKVIVVSLWTVLVSLGLVVALAVYFVWPRSSTEIQVLQTQKSPNGRWTAVVQQEVYNTAWVVNNVVYAVRLTGPAQKDPQGDLVMNAEVAYPVPRPFVAWKGDKLVVTLLDHEKYQYFTSPVDGIIVDVRRK